MADAIPVHSTPKAPKAGKVSVAPQTTDENGVPLPPDYILQTRENLGGEDVKSEVQRSYKLESHDAIREDY